jgi:predicted permease
MEMSPTPRPQRWATRLLQRAVPRGRSRDGLIGDLEELYGERRAEGQRLRADLWYAKQALSSAVRCHPRLRQAWDRIHEARYRRAGEPFGRAASACRLAARRLLRAPGFTIAAALTLMLGIGSTLIVFAVFHAVALRPLPYPEEDRLVVIEHPLPGFEANGEVPTLGGLFGQLVHYEERSRTLDEVGGYWIFDAAITEADNPEYVRIGGATVGFYLALGVRAAHGRLFDGDEPVPTADVRGRALLSHGLWQRRYDGDPEALGRLLATGGFEYEIVGVLPEETPFPPERAEIWNPIPRTLLQDNRGWTVARMVGRMAPGVSAVDVKRELDQLIGELPGRFPEAEFRRAVDEGRMEAEVTPLKDWLIAEVSRPLWLLLCAAGVVLMIAAVNVAGLVAVRTESQRREVELRVALGAGRGHVGGFFIAEGLLLSFLGGALGVALAATGMSFVSTLAPIGIPRLEGVGLGAETIGLSAALVAVSALLLSAVPLALCKRVTTTALSSRGRTATAGRASLQAHNLLVAGQLALSVILLVGTGLVIRSAVSLARVNLGFEVDQVLTLRIPFPFQEIQSADPGTRATPFYDLLSDRLGGLPGVTAVGYGSCLPLSPDCALGGTTLRREDLPVAEGALPVVGIVRVAPGYLEALGVPLLTGRPFERADHQQGRGVVLVNAGLAERFWPDGDALGSRVIQDGRPGWGSLEVVGVVGDVRFDDLRGSPEQIAYVPVLGPVTPQDLSNTSWVIRTAGAPMDLAQAVRREVAALRPDIPVANIVPLESVTSSSTARLRIVMWLLTVASGVAVALSAVGVYGVVAYVANLRRGELGIRLALGARASDLRALLMRQSATAALAGLAVGLVGAFFLGRLLAAIMFEVPDTDVPTFLAVILILSATAFVAALLPAWRAARVDPARILNPQR